MKNPYKKMVEEALKYKKRCSNKILKKGEMLPLSNNNEVYKTIYIDLGRKSGKTEYLRSVLSNNISANILVFDLSNTKEESEFKHFACNNIIIKCSDGHMGNASSLDFKYILVDNASKMNKQSIFDWLNKVKATVSDAIIMLG